MKLTKNESNQIILNKKVSIQLEPNDKFFFSPANKLIFVITPLSTSFTATAYDLKGVSKGSYEYKNAEFNKFCLRNGFANIVYCQTEANGKRCWYQGKLVDNGYMTDLFALHRTDANGLPIAMVDDNDAEDTEAEDDAEEFNAEPQSINEKVDDILEGLTPKEAEIFKTDPEDTNDADNLELKETKNCDKCGASIKAASTYCPMCGAAQN